MLKDIIVNFENEINLLKNINSSKDIIINAILNDINNIDKFDTIKLLKKSEEEKLYFQEWNGKLTKLNNDLIDQNNILITKSKNYENMLDFCTNAFNQYSNST